MVRLIPLLALGAALPAATSVTTATLFNTSSADAVLATMQIMPADGPWHQDVSAWPQLGNGATMIARIRADLIAGRPTRTHLYVFKEMNFVLVPDSQPLAAIDFTDYPDQSDPSPYPIPATMPIETWPSETGVLTNDEWQRDVNGDGGDRHAIIVMPGSGHLWETWQALKSPGGAWSAANGAKFDLNSNDLRPDGWTSGDAAGLPMFPALVRYDECQRGVINHTLRIVVRHSRAEHLAPATHHASVPSTSDPEVPAMGQRIRLRGDYPIPGSWSDESRCVAQALKTYGAFVADNGNFFSISVTPDDRWPDACFDDLQTIDINEFQVVTAPGGGGGSSSGGSSSGSSSSTSSTSSTSSSSSSSSSSSGGSSSTTSSGGATSGSGSGGGASGGCGAGTGLGLVGVLFWLTRKHLRS